jgi:hypothetical protein
MKNNLTPTEQKLFDLLNNRKGDNVWLLAIHNTIKTGCPKGFRNLLSQLRSEGEQVPETMKKIIGADTYELLVQL